MLFHMKCFIWQRLFVPEGDMCLAYEISKDTGKKKHISKIKYVIIYIFCSLLLSCTLTLYHYLSLSLTHTSPVSPIRPPCCPFINEVAMTSGRKWKEGRQTDSVKVLLWIYWSSRLVFGERWGHEGGEGGSPALLLAHLRSRCVINGQRLRISRRVCGVEESQRRKQKKREKLGSLWRKNTILCHSFTAQVMTKWLSVMIGPNGLFCLAASSSEVMIASETEEVKWCDGLSVILYGEHKPSVNLLL